MPQGIGRVVVVGSLNLDRWARVERLPAAGETLAALESGTGAGGKGLNQAVAAARSGAVVELVGCVGDDEAGRLLVDVLEGDGIGVDAVTVETGEQTGLAMVWVDRDGANSIVVVAGANARLGRDGEVAALLARLELGADDVVLAQGETALDLTERVFVAARGHGSRTVLNLAPYQRPSPDLLATTTVLVVNETEFALLVGDLAGQFVTGDDRGSDRSVALASTASAIVELGVEVVVVTLGDRGAVAVSSGAVHLIEAHAVEVVDTTGAGDGFVGVLAGELARGAGVADALRFASAAASLVVQQPGAATSMPMRPAIISTISGRRP